MTAEPAGEDKVFLCPILNTIPAFQNLPYNQPALNTFSS